MHNYATVIKWFTPLYNAARILGGSPPHLCSFTQILSLRSKNHTKLQHDILYHMSRYDLAQGLTGVEWDRIANQILLYLKANPQCKLASKPYQISNFTSCSKTVIQPGIELFSPSSQIQASESLN